MFRLITVLGLLAPGLVYTSFSDVNTACIRDNAGDTSNDFLVGTWYRITEFTNNGLISSRSCPEVKYTKPNQWQYQSYVNQYQSTGLPFTLDDNPILQEWGRNFFGMLSGEKEAKFQVNSPNMTSRIRVDNYSVNVFRRINDDFVLYWECALRGNRRWLFTRNKDTPWEETQRIIAGIPDVQRMHAIRYCVS